MTKAEANKVKKLLKTIGNYKVYYNSQKEELRVMVAECNLDRVTITTAMELANTNTIKILSLLTKSGLRPKYKKAEKLYQGYIKTHYIVFC